MAGGGCDYGGVTIGGWLWEEGVAMERGGLGRGCGYGGGYGRRMWLWGGVVMGGGVAMGCGYRWGLFTGGGVVMGGGCGYGGWLWGCG